MAYVDVAYAFFGTILNIFPHLEILLRTGMNLIKIASVCPLSHRSPSLSTFPNKFFKFDVLSIDKTAEIHLTDSGFHPTEFGCLILSAFFFQKKKKKKKNTHTHRVLSNEFLLTLTKFYKINLLYRVLLFSFSIEIIHHTFPTYNFLFFSM